MIARTGLQGRFEVKLKRVRDKASTEDGAEAEPGNPAAGSAAGPGPAAADPVSSHVP
ncbi:hypothetical protein QRX60_45940 [Amycolatopsis mongoliensis]|uniref:Uncharacterized protein n=1 Tax=Amycolatopsis mongoliensis TaxID=715475 RepID=A0A9Y2JPS8_9PSEU|nr:hypothetical protein [Amycolatopsis sp. 4-36]WIY01297.1 hypothetical protein QRX60_45940 [Amycolatopsis sp. 4-36]